MIWAGFAILILLTLLFFTVYGDITDTAADPIALYKKQLADLKKDMETGVLDQDAAEAARIEIERRILRVSSGGKASAASENTRAPYVFAGLAILGSVAAYYIAGSPNVAAAPGRMISIQDAPVEEGGPSFREAIERVEAHLETNQDDKQGWEVLAKSSRAVADFSRAATAFGKLAILEPDNSAWRAQELEAYIAMGGGQISPAAKLVLQQLLEQEPSHPAGHYYLGLARRQAGDEAGARAVWVALADRSAPNAPWMPTLNERLAELGVRPPQLSEDQMAAVAGMTEEERALFVESMIERLKERLESNPEDAEGWMMLARSELATKGKEAAIVSLEAGIKAVGQEKAVNLKALLDNLRSSNNP